jgi:hypothetical protein
MTSPKGRDARLAKLKTVPLIAARDHRLFLNDKGKDPRLQALPRNVRRRLKTEAKQLAAAYNRVLRDLDTSGAGYQPDQFLRQMAREYTFRYADSGLHTQPLNFNYFEPFCEISFFEKSVAPYAAPAPEIDHLFSVADYFDHITAHDAVPFKLASLLDVPEGKVFHYTPNGSLFDFTYTSANGRDFVVGGFSLIRHGSSLHWSLIGGELFSEADWAKLGREPEETATIEAHPLKVPFLAAMRKENGETRGKPLSLDGADRTQKTILAGEIDLLTAKHLGRYLSKETENVFQTICDDPELKIGHSAYPAEQAERREVMRGQIEQAAVMWDLAEAMLQLPAYFNHKVAVVRSIAVPEGRRAPATAPKAASGAGVRYRYVSALEYVDAGEALIRTFTAPRYAIETGGYWRRLELGAQGVNAAGDPVNGRTWVKAEHDWRARSDAPRPIYIKSSVAQAKLRRGAFLAKAATVEAATSEAGAAAPPAEEPIGVVYVLRCLAMQEEVYKVGWTKGTAPDRALQLSRDTGVPSAFVVVDRWAHDDPEALEGAVHAMLAPYRVSYGREFFRAPIPSIRATVEAEIRRIDRRS